MGFETLKYEVEDRVAVITLNRPEQRNAVNSVMDRELPQAWKAFKEDPDAVVAIVTGAGDKTFCAGADLADRPPWDSERGAANFPWTSLKNDVWKPVICAVNGTTIGGGLHFVAESDMVVAADNASFLDTHVKVGLVAGLEPVVLARRMPLDAVMRLMLTGGEERLSVQRAFELGLVGEVVPQQRLMDCARALADRIKQHSPASLARTKRAIWQSKELGLHDALDYAWRLIEEHTGHPDFEEGGRAWIEKRAPRWQPWDDEP